MVMNININSWEGLTCTYLCGCAAMCGGVRRFRLLIRAPKLEALVSLYRESRLFDDDSVIICLITLTTLIVMQGTLLDNYSTM